MRSALIAIKSHLAQLWNPEDLLDSLWSMFASPQTTMLLLLVLAVSTSLAILLPQEPAATLGHPMTNGVWLTSLRERYHDAADWMLALGLFDVYGSTWFRGLLGLLAFNLILGIVDLFYPRPRWSPALVQRGEKIMFTQSGMEARSLFEAAERALRAHRYRVVHESGGQWLYADHFVRPMALVSIGLLLAVAGLAVSERTAWWEEGVTLRPAQTRPLGHSTGLAIRAEAQSVDDTSGDDWNGDAVLTFLRGDQEVGSTILRSQAPAFWGGKFFYLTSTEPALLAQAQDADGRRLALLTPETGTTQFTEVALRFRAEQEQRYIVMLNMTPDKSLGRYLQQKGNEQYILIPSRNIYLRIVYSPPISARAVPTFQVQAFRNGEGAPFYYQEFQNTYTTDLGSDHLRFEPQRYVTVKFGQDWGAPVLLVGMLATLVGLVICAWRRPCHVWLNAQVVDGHLCVRYAADGTPKDGGGTLWLREWMQAVATGGHPDALGATN